MARKKKDNIEQDIQVIEQEQEQDNKENKEIKEQNKENIIIPDIVINTKTIEQKLNSYKRKLRRI